MDKFYEKISKTLDLLYRKFITSTAENSDNNITISIYPKDIKEYDLSIELIGEAVTALNKKDSTIKFIHKYDYDDFIADTYKDLDPSIYEIGLPLNFESKYRELKNFYSINDSKLKTLLTISEKCGIYKNKNKDLVYYVKRKRCKVILRLKKGKISGKNLSKLFYNSKIPRLSGEIKKINNIFLKKLNLHEDLIINLNSTGYQLNRESYEIEFSKF